MGVAARAERRPHNCRLSDPAQHSTALGATQRALVWTINAWLDFDLISILQAKRIMETLLE